MPATEVEASQRPFWPQKCWLLRFPAKMYLWKKSCDSKSIQSGSSGDLCGNHRSGGSISFQDSNGPDAMGWQSRRVVPPQRRTVAYSGSVYSPIIGK